MCNIYIQYSIQRQYTICESQFGTFITFRVASANDLLTHHKERPAILNNLSMGGSAQDLHRWYVFDLLILRPKSKQKSSQHQIS